MKNSKTNKIGVRKINSFLKQLPVVKYKSNGSFGHGNEVGGIYDAHLISDEGFKALLYFSTDFKDCSCGTFVICQRKYKNRKSNDFVYVDFDEESWINLI